MTQKEEPKIRHTIREDLRSPDLRKNLSEDYRDLKENFLDDDKKEQLKNMRALKRFFKISWWLLRSMFFRMTPVRRLMFVLGITLILMSNVTVQTGSVSGGGNNLHVFGGIILVFVLMLELKDKLLAKDELEAGHKVQLALMPNEITKIPGWNVWLFTKSANDVGGDLIDYIEFSKKEYGISIGDVAGKGLSAALIMAKLQATIRALAGSDISLSKLIRDINKIFHRDSLKSIFASLVYINVKADNSLLKLVNAGHMPPVMIRENEIKSLPKGGPAIGLIEELDLAETELEFKSGDKLFIYSDGITEASDEKGDFFGEQRLMKVLENQKHRNAQDLGQ